MGQNDALLWGLYNVSHRRIKRSICKCYAIGTTIIEGEAASVKLFKEDKAAKKRYLTQAEEK